MRTKATLKNPLTLLCGAVALLCLFSMFVPLVAPRYSAAYYHPASDSYTADYFFTGDYYQAKAYWSIAKFARTDGVFHRVAVSISMDLLLYWCVLSFLGEKTPLVGLLASLTNLAVLCFSLVRMTSMAGGTRPFVIGVVLMDAVVAVICAVLASLPAKWRYTTPINPNRTSNPSENG